METSYHFIHQNTKRSCMKYQPDIPCYTTVIINPRRACAARVTVVVLCVCVCVSVCPLHFGHYE